MKVSGKKMIKCTGQLINNCLIIKFYNFLINKYDLRYYDINTLEEITTNPIIEASSFITITSSKDRSKHAIITSSESSFEYFIFDENFNFEYKNTVNWELIKGNTSDSYFSLDNLGSLYLPSINNYKEHSTPTNYIYKISKHDFLKKQEFSLPDTILSESLILELDTKNEVSIFGYYKPKESNTTLCFFNFNFSSDLKLKNQNIKNFPNNFLKLRWQDYQDKRLYHSKEIDYYSNKVVKALNTKKGKLIIGEQQFYATSFAPSPSHEISNTDDGVSAEYFYKKDIILSKIDSLGNIQWMNKIEKKQFTKGPYNDLYISHVSAIIKNKAYFLFNDHKNNKSLQAVKKVDLVNIIMLILVRFQ